MSVKTRWAQLGGQSGLREVVARWLADPWSCLLPSDSLDAEPPRILPLYLDDEDDACIIRAPFLGARAQDVDLTLDGDVLTMQGEIPPIAADGSRIDGPAWGPGPFLCRIVLPHQVRADNAAAQTIGGMFTLRLPKAEQAPEPDARGLAVASDSSAPIPVDIAASREAAPPRAA